MLEASTNISYIIAQLLLFIAVIMVFYSARNILVLRTGTARRLKQKIETARSSAHSGAALALDNSRTLKRYEKYLVPEDEGKLNALRLKLVRAGYRNPAAVRIFYAYRLFLSLAATLFGVTVLPMIMVESPLIMTLGTMFLLIMIAFFAPSFWVERTAEYRKIDMEKSFPDALDLLLVCIEAGNGFDQALARVVHELGASHKHLAEELQIVTRELRAGKDRYKVLGDFAERSGVDGIISFITVIKQADKFGVSIAEALRVYSAEMRDRRYMKAEEKANMMPVKLALGAIMFTVPPAILVMVGPSIIMIIRHLGGIHV